MTLVRAACHCTAVKLMVKTPEWVLDCNCTICRRYGALWTYPQEDEVELLEGSGSTDTYIWGDKALAFHRCKECGCVTHFTAIDSRVFGVNARMIPTLDPARVEVRQKDNGHSGVFWTKASNPPEPSHHPAMDPPGADDWR